MPTYRVLGEKPMMYWTEVEAKDSYEAYDKAEQLDSVEWNEIETDNIIEPVDVYLNDDTEEEIILEDDEEFVFDPINVIGDIDEA
jgi:hypothetical protein